MTAVLPHPNGEQVAAAWIGALPGLFTTMVSAVGYTLPAAWDQASAPVFVQTTVPSGIVNRAIPLRQPYVQVDAWAAPGRLGEVALVAEMIYDATYDGSGLGDLAVLPGFALVSLTDVSAFTEPRQIRDDPSRLARATQILAFQYTVKE